MMNSAIRLSPLLLLACRNAPTDLQTSNFSVTTDRDGVAEVSVPLSRDDRSFLLTGLSAQGGVSVEALYDHRGREVLYWGDWWDSPRAFTDAFYPSVDTVLNWPVRDEDQGLHSGTWTVLLSVVDQDGNYQSGVDLEGSVAVKQDDELDEGVVRVLLIFAEGLDQDPVVVDGVERAVARWVDIWSAYGVTPRITYASSDLDPALQMDTGSDALAALSPQSSARDILVVVGEDINGDELLFGIAGSIPGTLGASSRAGVYISWLTNAGGDGEFSDEDVRLFGETMAHEVGHYTGLYHPVEASYDAWDALGDTTECGDWERCESRMGDNLMFPYPICDRSSCVAQSQLTHDQAGVFHLYTGTL